MARRLLLPLPLLGLTLLTIAWGAVPASTPSLATSPPVLEFIYHDLWWAHSAFEADNAGYRIVAGDFNGDGLGDIAMLYDTSVEAMDIYVLLSTGHEFAWQGSWLEISGGVTTADMFTGRVAAGDFNNDGYDDVVAFGGNTVTQAYVFLSDGSSFLPVEYWWDGAPSYQTQITGRVVAGDFDGDSWQDDIAALYDEGGTSTRADVFISDGGSFAEPQEWWSSDSFYAGYTTFRVVAGDFDANGADDVATVYYYVANVTRIHLLLSRFGSEFVYEWGWWEGSGYNADYVTGRVVAGDFDGDGDDDITLLYDYGGVNTGGHVFLSTREALVYQVPGWWSGIGYQAGRATGRVVAGDWDGDGVDDVSMIYDQASYETRAQVLESTAPSPGPPTTRHVDHTDPTCSDGGGTPYCNIQAAVDAANNGDTILVAKGTYTDSLGVPKHGPGFNQSLTIQGSGTDSTFLDGQDDHLVLSIHLGGSLTLSKLTIQNGASDSGGGINNAGQLTILDSMIRDNFSTTNGGGIRNAGPLVITNSQLSGNIAQQYGGGIYSYTDEITIVIEDSTFIANSAPLGGGGLFSTDDYGGISILESTFSGNSAPNGGGGAISAYNEMPGTTYLRNSTLSSNFAMYGGGIYNLSYIALRNSTLNDNSASGNGGGIYNATQAARVLAYNTIVANSPSGGNCNNLGIWDTAFINLDSDDTCPGFSLLGNPLLGPLQDNGGPTQTHALLEGSPAIDVGSNADCNASDQRGLTRPQDGDGDGVAICDIGAFEYGTWALYLPTVLRP